MAAQPAQQSDPTKVASELRASAMRQTDASTATVLRSEARRLEDLAMSAEVLATKARVLDLEGKPDDARLARAEHASLCATVQWRAHELLSASRSSNCQAAMSRVKSGVFAKPSAAEHSELGAPSTPISALRPAWVALPPSPPSVAPLSRLRAVGVGGAAASGAQGESLELLSPECPSDPSNYIRHNSAWLASPPAYPSRASLDNRAHAAAGGGRGVALPFGGISPSEVLRAGWLTKRSVGTMGETAGLSAMRGWRERYVVLTVNRLCVYLSRER